MPTPLVNGAASIIQRTGGLPCAIAHRGLQHLAHLPRRACPSRGRTPIPHVQEGDGEGHDQRQGPQDVGDAQVGPLRDQPADHRPRQHGRPADDLALGEDRLEVPLKPVNLRASTSQASVAPEKKVKPRPSRAEVTAQAQNGASICQASQYRAVETARVTDPSR